MLNENSSLLSLGHSSFFRSAWSPKPEGHSQCLVFETKHFGWNLSHAQHVRILCIFCGECWKMSKTLQNDHDLLNHSWPSGTNIRSNGIQTHTGTSQSILSQSKNRILKISKMNVLRQDGFPGSVMPLFPSALFNAFLPRLRGSCGWWWGESLNHCEQFATDNRNMNVDNSKALRLCFHDSGSLHCPSSTRHILCFMAFLNCIWWIHSLSTRSFRKQSQQSLLLSGGTGLPLWAA